jgi:hypothetical protein
MLLGRIFLNETFHLCIRKTDYLKNEVKYSKFLSTGINPENLKHMLSRWNSPHIKKKIPYYRRSDRDGHRGEKSDSGAWDLVR